MVSYDKVLPIGTVVLLKNATKRLMILGYQRTAAADESVVFDYCGCVYPDGYLNPERTAIFNHENIERVYYLGLQNDEYLVAAEKIREVVAAREAQQGNEN